MLGLCKILTFVRILKISNKSGGIYQWRIQNPVKHLRWTVFGKKLTIFAKMLHLRWLTWFWINLCIPYTFKNILKKLASLSFHLKRSSFFLFIYSDFGTNAPTKCLQNYKITRSMVALISIIFELFSKNYQMAAGIISGGKYG